MTDQIFGPVYADQYDLIYGEKDYAAECALLQRIFSHSALIPVEKVLDLGCGTGSHAMLLAQAGYRVTGVDLSAEMLRHARAKARQASGLRSVPVFQQGDLRQVALGEQFDAVSMMFAVLSYQLTSADISAALQTVRRHLKPGGVFCCDFWYGPAVLSIRPDNRVKVIRTGADQTIRTATARLDVAAQTCQIEYHLRRLSRKQALSETVETHRLRYFFPQELNRFFRDAGLSLQCLAAFPDPQRPADETTWNALAIAR